MMDVILGYLTFPGYVVRNGPGRKCGLSECYFAGKGTALVLPDADASIQHAGCSALASNGQQSAAMGGCSMSGSSSAIQKHLQSMFYLLRPEETLKMAVKLESVHPTRTRYLVVVSRMGGRGEECCLLGIDCNERTTVGLVLRVLANTTITLDGDGGFSVSVCDRHHIFKPVSVQAMWSALQTLHKVSAKAREENYFQGGMTHGWVDYYEERIESERSCLNEWHAMDNLESRRPPSPDSVRTKPTEREETEKVIRSTLKEIMMSVDLDEVTSKVIRSRLEEELDMDLGEYKSFIDQEMLVILGQMDAPTEIFEHVYLGSEWNASNYEELQRNGVGHILNVTREIDNFFPGTFDYLNVRVYDDEKTDLLKHWDDTFKYITKARNEGSKVLVHCKMGVSRSASVVIAYAMKAYNWDFQKALLHVKKKRSCIKPNNNFLNQLETYQGILDAMKNKEKLQRSKSETNLKSPTNSNKTEKIPPGSEPTPVVQALSKSYDLQSTLSGQDLRQMGARPKSWSPDSLETRELREGIKSSPGFLSLEDLSQKSASKESVQESKLSLARHVLIPCDNGESYSVSPNKIVHLPGHDSTDKKESLSRKDESKFVSGVGSRFGETNEHSSCNFSSKTGKSETTWDPGEVEDSCRDSPVSAVCDQITNLVNESAPPVWTSSTVIKTQSAVSCLSNFSASGNSGSNFVPESQSTRIKNAQSDPFSNQLDRVFDREEKRQQRLSGVAAPPAADTQTSGDGHLRECPSRQSSWSSYDSAVALGFPETAELSRHSSWGSGDTRMLPSRNSSWGSYDIRPRGSVYYNNEKGEKILHSTSDLEHSSSGIFPYDREEIPWHPGTVKRTKQRLENAPARQLSNGDSSSNSTLSLVKTPSSETLLFNFAEAVNDAVIDRAKTTEEKSSAISESIDIPVDDRSGSLSPSVSRLSISAPEQSSMGFVSQECSLSRSASNVSPANGSIVKQHKKFLEDFHKDAQASNKRSDDSESGASGSLGKVKNLKKEFEAKLISCANCPEQSVAETSENGLKVTTSKTRVSSLPSSPVCAHHAKEQPKKSNDDMNFKVLRSVFESKKEENQVKLRQKLGKSNAAKTRNTSRYSCFEVSVDKTPRIIQTPLISNLSKSDTEYKRPPVAPSVKSITATVIAKAAKKQQQYGKSHPLAKLNVKPRHNNPVYNTM
ncbi:protein phosphatase Slingshot isoform X3 [Cylas formicarius]|uniref:protein phosphatase Slingshot isoform X3 n=1 Tax=Cylas formicarius TaxID=197179 RepID=UPI002958A4AC|nr:protein phosphatase Slingshot isoform X3 [Cylas formicarius]